MVLVEHMAYGVAYNCTQDQTQTTKEMPYACYHSVGMSIVMVHTMRVVILILLAQLPFLLKAQDSLFYVNKAVSVVKSEWKENRRSIQLFDLKGNNTYTTEEVQASFQVRVSFTFHKNGAVKTATIRTNPGASRYHYETMIEFDSVNQPLTKIKKRLPEDYETISKQKIEFWNRKQQRWVTQEQIKCNPRLKAE